MITVIAQIETIPPDHTGVDPDRQADEIKASGQTYEEARDAIAARVPAGWRAISYRVPA
ncbi:hypothetical protein CHO01_31740 [Cellulomonas hominis]|uniref:Uncharacterized protein n=1 Tax=Cellulomonas hominis TaxID=156981 RepID=A0A511FJN9_9CELL|nr:hypothetical protein [Cellulomonas hominis]MBB5474834.1 hypothetical protein [Cellulomonas hominis]NKY05640.1 hypothetical protein [Cellulomonas hominis]GEL48058.1 hypothetical protein CHO01_31740 [Cellulomonas hominis]